MRRLSVAGAIAAVLLLGSAGSAHACSCAASAPGEALRKADAAIVGELVEVLPRGEWVADFRYRVQHVYKHGRGLAVGAVVSVRSALSGATCGLPNGVGKRYGLFLGRHGDRWRGSSCATIEPRRLASAASGARHDRAAASGIDCAS